MTSVAHVQCPDCGRGQQPLDGVTILPGGALRYYCGDCSSRWTEWDAPFSGGARGAYAEPRVDLHAGRSAA
jgi:hypothetical protein